MVNFTAADRVGAIGGYIGGISALLGGLGNWNGGCHSGNYVSKETFEMQTKLTEAEKNNAILSADLASEKKMVEVYNAAAQGRTEAGDYGESDFLCAVAGADAESAWLIMDELMSALRLVNDRAYDSVMRKLRNI